MIYIIVSNVGLIIMMIYIYFRYSHFRISSAKEIRDLREKNDKQSQELRDFDAKLLSSIKGYQDKVEALLIEVGKVRSEKEKEVEMRTTIEKKYEIINQKNSDFETIHDEITSAISNIVNDTHETAKNLSKDIQEKISHTLKEEAQESQKLIAKINQNVSDFVAKFNSAQNQVIREKEDTKYLELFQNTNGEIANNLINDVINLIKTHGFLPLENFISSNHIDANKAKLLLCEIAFVKNNQLFILDFKGTNYIFEFFASKAKNDKMADENFNIKYRRYLMLISNQKYYDIINQLLQSLGFNYSIAKINLIVPSKSEIKLLKDLQYYDKARQLNLDIIDIDDLSKIL